MDKKLKNKRKTQLLEAAMQVFSEKGYSLTRMDDIAEFAGVSKGSIYNYFSSKQELFRELFMFMVADDIRNLMELFASGISSREKIVGATQIMIDRFRRNEFTGKLFLEYWATANLAYENDEFLQTIKHIYKTFQDIISNILTEGSAKGELKLVAPADISAKMLIALVDGVGLQIRLGMTKDWSDSDYRGFVTTIENLMM